MGIATCFVTNQMARNAANSRAPDEFLLTQPTEDRVWGVEIFLDTGRAEMNASQVLRKYAILETARQVDEYAESEAD